MPEYRIETAWLAQPKATIAFKYFAVSLFIPRIEFVKWNFAIQGNTLVSVGFVQKNQIFVIAVELFGFGGAICFWDKEYADECRKTQKEKRKRRKK